MIYDFGKYTYNSETGDLTSKRFPNHIRKPRPDGYMQTRDDDGKLKYIHIYIWEKLNGPVPEGFEIDHRDRNRSNNKYKNLRCITVAENAQNKQPKPSTHLPGVAQRKSGLFRARIAVNGQRIHIGNFATEEEANKAYIKWKKNWHVEGAA